MPLDAICISGLCTELVSQVVGAKIDKVQQPGKDLIILSMRVGGNNKKLLISAGSGTARVHLSTESYENPQTPPMFCMLLRKHLVGARITNLEQPEKERILTFRLLTYDEMGVESEKSLVVELMGRNSNIILTASDGIIIDCLRRVDGDMSRQRQVLPGLFYRLPPAVDKPLFSAISREEMSTLLSEAPDDALSDKWLLNSLFGLSPLICRELSFRACGQVQKPLGAFSKEEKDAFLNQILLLRERCEDENFEPFMLLKDSGPADFSFMEIMQYENAMERVPYTDFSHMLEAFYTQRDKREQMKRKTQSLHKSVKSAHDRAVRKLAARRQELLKTEDRDELRKKGDLVTANLFRLKKGDRSLTAQDYYVDGCPEVEIRLDPLKTPQQNAAAFYRSYNKAKTAVKYLGDLIDKGEKEEAYLLSVLEEIQRCESERDLSEIRRELIETGYLRRQKNAKKEKVKETLPMRFMSSAGFPILAGKNNTQNDKLTLKDARRTDVWLHAQKIHGSHVIIQCDGKEPDDVTLGEAATIAAYYSQGRESGKIPVDYTQVRFVKKPSGSLPGAVIYTDYKTILAVPDEKLVFKLHSEK